MTYSSEWKFLWPNKEFLCFVVFVDKESGLAAFICLKFLLSNTDISLELTINIRWSFDLLFATENNTM